MILSTTTAIYRDRPEGMCKIPVQDSIRRLHKAGFPSADINFNQMSKRDLELTQDDWIGWAEDTAALLAGLGITAPQCHVPFYNVLEPKVIPNPEHTEEIIRRALIAAGKMGVKTAVIHPGTHFGENSYKKNLHDNAEYLKPHLDEAAEQGISLAIENLFDRRDQWNFPRKFAAQTDALLDLCELLEPDYPNIGVCWDFGHANIQGYDQVQAMHLLGSRLIATHVDDNYGIADDHLLPYMGNIDWPPIMKALHEINYQGAFAFETHRLTNTMPEEMIDASLRYACELGLHLMSLAK